MEHSVFGTNFRIMTWGESHGAGVGVTIDGVPAGLSLCEKDIQDMLDRRRPGQSDMTTARSEADRAAILSGVFEGVTLGTPIAIEVRNQDQHSRDYSNLKDVYRPGHADYGFDSKYGFRDHRGGGRSSGRETIGRVAAGAVAAKLLAELGISVTSYTRSIGDVEIGSFDADVIRTNPLFMPDAQAAERATEYVRACREDKDSCGGVIETRVQGMMPGIGDPVFGKLDAALAGAMFSIGAVKGFEIGEGFNAARLRGSENNDPFVSEDGHITKRTNHSGGILGGISDGDEIVFRVAVKPTPSIAREQDTVDRYGNNTRITISGRHDPVIVPRAVVVVEAMTDLVLADAVISGLGARLSNIKEVYKR